MKIGISNSDFHHISTKLNLNFTTANASKFKIPKVFITLAEYYEIINSVGNISFLDKLL